MSASSSSSPHSLSSSLRSSSSSPRSPGSSPDPEQDPASLSSFHLPPAVDTVSWYPPSLCVSSTNNAIYGHHNLFVHGGHTGIKEIDEMAAFIVNMFQVMARLRLSIKKAKYYATLSHADAEEIKEITKDFWNYHDICLLTVQSAREVFESDFLIPAPPVPPSLFHHF